MTYEEFLKDIQAVIPEVEFDFDNDGQIIIYTGMGVDSDDNILSLDELNKTLLEENPCR